ncbi:3'-5' exonuclease family protein [Histomonas meleagridis]|uniref:3'-5' exonuclease family protein n=1 Tax=Histomonas meleagridis TaxID=135588 RepID=UPI003559C318|nr:3'-5' exonuclease family protein [Histomonas meleagridis]KAH0797758.1 3'-5' exonuclease family protein [Histomonas meleagridis]
MRVCFPEIHFGEKYLPLQYYSKYKWSSGETRKVEFYPNKIIPVTVIDASDPHLSQILQNLIDGKWISADFEWAQKFMHSKNDLDTFQYASSKGVLVVTANGKDGVEAITKFHQSAKFVGKGVSEDKKHFLNFSGVRLEIEDIHTRLNAFGLTLNFGALTHEFIGEPCAQFKDKKVQCSNWSLRPLSILQVLYASHDAYAILQIYNSFIEKYGTEIPKPPPSDKPSSKSQKSIESHNIINEDPLFAIESNTSPSKYEIIPNLPIKELVLRKTRELNIEVNDEDDFYLNRSNDLIFYYMLPNKTSEEKKIFIAQMNLASEFLLRGYCIQKPLGIGCLHCFKYKMSFNGSMLHCYDVHIDKNDINNYEFNVRDTFMKYLASNLYVNCPFTLSFLEKDLKRLNFDTGKTFQPINYDEGKGNYCNICNKSFENYQKLSDHCWIQHSDLFEEFYGRKSHSDRYEENGFFIINKLNLVTIDNDNLIHCNLCDKKLFTPSKLFVHMLYSHPHFSIVSKSICEKYEFAVKNLPKDLHKKIFSLMRSKLLKMKLNLFDENEKKCTECNVPLLNDSEKVKHFIMEHAVFSPL